MTRIVSPKVHVEVWRPIEFNAPRTRRIEPKLMPNTITWQRRVDVEDKRVKGIQFEETALFGGFIEINIAEDPSSDLFDHFQPNDHVEVFYEDTETVGTDGDQLKQSFFKGYKDVKNKDIVDGFPKFSGTTWKSDLMYSPSRITTKIHAWDYLRVMQYYNVPRGDNKSTRLTFVESRNDENIVSVREGKYRNDYLDYVDRVLRDMINTADDVSLYGQRSVSFPSLGEGSIGSDAEEEASRSEGGRIEFSQIGKNGSKTRINMKVAGIGKHCHEAVQKTPSNTAKKEDLSNLRLNFDWEEGSSLFSVPPYRLDNISDVVDALQEQINNMEAGDINLFRFIDGSFKRTLGVNEQGEFIIDESKPIHLTADIVVIDQFALMQMMVSGLTIHHQLNQWFTPILGYNDTLLHERAREANNFPGYRTGTSKLVYIRVQKDGKPFMNFNKDTFPEFVGRFGDNLLKIVLANIKRIAEDNKTKKIAPPDVFSTVLANVDFPQPELDSGSFLSLMELFTSINSSYDNTKTTGQAEFMNTLMTLFVTDFDTSAIKMKESMSEMVDTMQERVANYGLLMREVMNMDDSIISLIMNMPSSYMRADIYTGSKFKTFPYDSLSIIRLLQIIASAMRGFPQSNNPQNNTEEGVIDSYPIFAANRMVVRTRAVFGKGQARVVSGEHKSTFYNYSTSLSKLAEGNKETNASCLMLIELGFKNLVKSSNSDFEIPLEQIQDFGIIKATATNHRFNFSLGDINSANQLADSGIEYAKRTVDSGFTIKYNEAGVDSFGFAPPEHSELTMLDLTQEPTYSSVSARGTPVAPNDNNNTVSTSLTRKDSDNNIYFANDYDEFKVVRCKPTTDNADLLGAIDSNGNFTGETFPLGRWHATTQYADITDIRNEFRVLQLIMSDEDNSYKDISNVSQELIDNVVIREIFRFEIDLDADTFEEKINLNPAFGERERGTQGSLRTLRTVVDETVEELNKLEKKHMQWLFPTSGYNYPREDVVFNESSSTAGERESLDGTIKKHYLLIFYLDLLIKGIRYMLWSIAKSRMFAHIYVPIESSKFAKKAPSGFRLRKAVIEPGSSVIFTIDKNNSLMKEIDPPKIPFQIEGSSEDRFKPLVQTVQYKKTKVEDLLNQRIDETSSLHRSGESNTRKMVWYVSKKETYIGADGAMMRLELTEGSLDWTLFYNEKNMLTQISEHYFLQGLPDTRVV